MSVALYVFRLVLLVFIGQCLAFACVFGLCSKLQNTQAYLPVLAQRTKMKPTRYIEVGVRSPYPCYLREWRYTYRVNGQEYQGKPLDAYTEDAGRSDSSAVVFYNPDAPHRFLLRKKPYIDKQCATVAFFLGLLFPVLLKKRSEIKPTSQ